MGGTRLRPPDVIPPFGTGDLEDNSVTDPKIAPQESTKITGLPTQTKALNMGFFPVQDVQLLEMDSIVTPSQTGSPAIGNLFLDSLADDRLSIRKDGPSVDIEAPALGISTGENSVIASVLQTQGESPLDKVINEVSIVLNNNDVVTLPPAVAFLTIVILNKGAKDYRYFPLAVMI